MTIEDEPCKLSFLKYCANNHIDWIHLNDIIKIGNQTFIVHGFHESYNTCMLKMKKGNKIKFISFPLLKSLINCNNQAMPVVSNSPKNI